MSGPAVDLIAAIQDSIVAALDALHAAFTYADEASEQAAGTLAELEGLTRLSEAYQETGGDAGNPEWYLNE